MKTSHDTQATDASVDRLEDNLRPRETASGSAPAREEKPSGGGWRRAVNKIPAMVLFVFASPFEPFCRSVATSHAVPTPDFSWYTVTF